MPALTEEIPFFFPCEGENLLGIISAPVNSAPTGVLIVVGGPQYRVGAHRQFVHLARHLAASGVACMRFDYRGMGDGSGAMRTFEQVEADLRAAMDAFVANYPPIRRVVLWGLCDGASAECFYAANDRRVAGAVLVNPWVRTEAGEARTYLRHYYLRRLLSRAFWQKLLDGGIDLQASLGSFLRAFRLALGARREGVRRSARQVDESDGPLPERMARGLQCFDGRILVILSGNDYTAKEFCQVRAESVSWARALNGADSALLEEADHTFSTHAWKAWVAETTARWVAALPSAEPQSPIPIQRQ
jgi:exosortase A-associated hydrolase 1